MLARLLLCFSLLFCVLVCHAAETPPTRLPEVVAAEKLSEMTGIALNPLLVGGAMRAWEYQQTAPEQRAQLHWSAQPWFWGTLLSVGLLFLLNNTIGRLIPPTAKVMDIVEHIEGYLAPIYTSTLLMPLGIQLIHALEQSSLSPIGLAHAADLSMAWQDPIAVFLGTMLALIITGIVWLGNQAAHTLVLLSPSGLISLFVRIIQWSIVLILLLATWIHPILGAICALLILVICCKIAGWSFRLTVFGAVLCWDLLSAKNTPAQGPLLAFSGSGLPLPKRTLGYFDQEQFCYCPWLIFPKKRMVMPSQNNQLSQGIWLHQLHTASGQTLLSFPPRYRKQTAPLSQLTNSEIRPSSLRQGLKDAWRWLQSSA